MQLPWQNTSVKHYFEKFLTMWTEGLKYKILFLILLKNGSVVNVTAQKNGSMPSSSGYQYTTFQEGVICTPAMQPLHPSTLCELQEIVKVAIENKFQLKAIGNLNSGTDIVCTDGIPVSMLNINHYRYNAKTNVVTVGAGIMMGTVLNYLHNNGRTLHGIPAYEDITIGGAIGTGSHGTGFYNPATLSDQVVGVVIVDGVGNVKNITDSETLKAFRAHLGLLGLVYEVTFSTIPQYKMQIDSYPLPDSLLFEESEIMRLLKSNDRFQFFWFPISKSAVISVGNQVPLETVGNCRTHFISDTPPYIPAFISNVLEKIQEDRDHLRNYVFESLMKRSLFQKLPGRSPIYSEDKVNMCQPAVGYNHRMSANKCSNCAWSFGKASVFQFEYSAIIPLSEFSAAINTIRSILQESPMEVPMTGIYFRFLPPSDGLLTVNSGNYSVAIDWILVPRKDRFNKPMLGLSSSQAIMQALIREHGGRSHWGKNGPIYTHHSFLKKNYPNLPIFIKQMEQFDPHGIFLNDFGRRIRFEAKTSAMDSYTTHCALADICICQSNQDCGDGSAGSYTCDKLQNQHVCKENSINNFFPVEYVRNIIDEFPSFNVIIESNVMTPFMYIFCFTSFSYELCQTVCFVVFAIYVYTRFKRDK